MAHGPSSWFAYISPTEPCLLSDVLITPKHGLTHQVNEHYLPKLIAHNPTHDPAEQEATARNVLLNVDGIGVAWYTASSVDFETGTDNQTFLKPAVYKTIQPPKSDDNLHSICANTETLCCFAHIRATSASAVISVNNHPFTFGRITFMHNGSVSDFTAIRRTICDELDDDTYAAVQGSTDSEHVAGLYVMYLTSGRGRVHWDAEYSLQDMKTALLKAVAFVIDAQQRVLGAEAAAPNSLNLAVTDGTKMVAIRFRNSASEQPPSLYWSDRAGVTLNKKYPDHPDGCTMHNASSRLEEDAHGVHVIVASEPSTYKDDDWELIGKNQILMVGADGKMTIEDVPYNNAWDARAVDKSGAMVC